MLTVIALIKKWRVLRNVYVCVFFVLWFFVPLENFSFILSHHNYRCKSWKFWRYAVHSWPFCSEGFLACHTYCDTGHRFKLVIYEDPWHSHLLPRDWQWNCLYRILRRMSVCGWDLNTKPSACVANAQTLKLTALPPRWNVCDSQLKLKTFHKLSFLSAPIKTDLNNTLLCT